MSHIDTQDPELRLVTGQLVLAQGLDNPASNNVPVRRNRALVKFVAHHRDFDRRRLAGSANDMRRLIMEGGAMIDSLPHMRLFRQRDYSRCLMQCGRSLS